MAGSSASSALQSERLAGLSAWFVALDGFLAESPLDQKPESVYRAWVKWSPVTRLPASSIPVDQPGVSALPGSQVDKITRYIKDHAPQALNELAMVSLGTSAREDGLVPVSHLPLFASAVAALQGTQGIGALFDAAEVHDGANPLRVLLSFLASLTVKDRDAFRVLAGIELDVIFRLLDNPEMLNSAHAAPGASQAGTGTYQPGSVSTVTSRSISKPTDLVDAERLLVLWRSSRLRSSQFQQGSLTHAVARAETGKYLAYLLDTQYGVQIFNQGWAGERFAQDAKQDLAEAWSAIGRAVAIDLRREAAPWLARRLGTSSNPSFNLEYTVRPSPSNPYLALMTMRAIVNGVAYGIPYQVAARALSSAASDYFDAAPIPLRYVEEPLPGLRIYVPRDDSDSSRAIADLIADLSTAYPAALRVPSSLVHIPLDASSDCEKVCIALDGAYREAATGARLAHSFTALLHDKGYPSLASMILPETPIGMEDVLGLFDADDDDASNENGRAD